MSDYVELDGYYLISEYNHQRLLEVGDKYGIPRKDTEDLFMAITASGSVESCSEDFIDGVDAILKAGFRRA